MAVNAWRLLQILQIPEKIACYDMRFVKPLDEKLLHIDF